MYMSSSLSSYNASLSQNGSVMDFNITNTSTSPVVITDIAQGTYSYSVANTITVYSMPFRKYERRIQPNTWTQVGQAIVITCLVEQASQIHYLHHHCSFKDPNGYLQVQHTVSTMLVLVISIICYCI